MRKSPSFSSVLFTINCQLPELTNTSTAITIPNGKKNSALQKAKLQSDIFRSALETYNQVFNGNLGYLKIVTKGLKLSATPKLEEFR